MKKILLFMLVLVSLFAFVACADASVEEDNIVADTTANQEKTEEEVRIDEDNAVILPKLNELEAITVEMVTYVTDNGYGDLYKSQIDVIESEVANLYINHQSIIDMGGYLEGTDEFVAAIDAAIVENKEYLDIIKEDIEATIISNELNDKINELIDVVNEVSISTQENGWDANEDFLSELEVTYGFIEEIQGKIKTPS